MGGAKREADVETRDMLWSGWGDPAKAAPLPEPMVGLLRDMLGVRPAAAPRPRSRSWRWPSPGWRGRT